LGAAAFLCDFRIQDLDDLAAVEADAGVVGVVVGHQEIAVAFDDGGVAVTVAAVILNIVHPVSGKGLAVVGADGADIGGSAPGLFLGSAVVVGLGVEYRHGVGAGALDQHGRGGGGEEVVGAKVLPCHALILGEALTLAAQVGTAVAPDPAVFKFIQARLLEAHAVGGKGHGDILLGLLPGEAVIIGIEEAHDARGKAILATVTGVQTHRVEDPAALQPQHPVVIENIVVGILVFTHAVDGLAPGFTLIGGANHPDIVGAVGIFENVESADVAVAHAQEGKAHDILAVYGALQDHMLFTPGLAFVTGDNAGNAGLGVVTPAGADILCVAVENGAVLQADERAFAVAGIAFTGGKKQDLFADFFHICHLEISVSQTGIYTGHCEPWAGSILPGG